MAGGTPARDARIEESVRALVDRFVTDLLAVVGGARAGAAARSPSAVARRKRLRRTAGTLRRLADAVLGVLARTSDRSVSELASAVGSTPRDVVRPLTLLLAEGRVTKRGERKGTRYSLARQPTRAAPRAVPARKGRTRPARAGRTKRKSVRKRKR